MDDSNQSLLEEKFILMRVGGYSFSKIAEEIGVSKPTLIKWGKKFAAEIYNQSRIEIEELREEYISRIIARIYRF